MWTAFENGISYLYSKWEVLQCIWSNLWYSYDGEMKSQMESNMKGLRATYNVFFLTFFYMPSSTVQCIEVQVCTFLQHIWSNVQLSMGYLLKEFSEFHVGENIGGQCLKNIIWLKYFLSYFGQIMFWSGFKARYQLTVSAWTHCVSKGSSRICDLIHWMLDFTDYGHA